jgi:hypothetical protein
MFHHLFSSTMCSCPIGYQPAILLHQSAPSHPMPRQLPALHKLTPWHKNPKVQHHTHNSLPPVKQYINRPYPWLCIVLRNKYLVLWGRVVSPHPTPKLEDHPLSAVRDRLFNIFAATLHIWRPSPLSATRAHAMPW